MSAANQSSGDLPIHRGRQWPAVRYGGAIGTAMFCLTAVAVCALAGDAAPANRSSRVARWHLADRPTNATAAVREPIRASDGSARFRFDTGAVRVEYQPEWSSRDRMAPPGYGWGSGPGHWVTLFEAGIPDQGSFALAIDPEGTNLVFTTRDPGGVTRTNLQTRISWTFLQPQLRGDNRMPWREVALNYTPTFCTLIVDGAQQSDWQTKTSVGRGVNLPRLSQSREARLALGGGLLTDTDLRGRLGTVETYADAMTPMHSQPQLAQTVLSTAIETNPASVTLRWAGLPGTKAVVRRREWGQTNWVMVTRAAGENTFTDRDPALQVGQVWEYTVDNRTIVVALNRPPVEDRGRVLVLVDETIARRIDDTLDQFAADLSGDGWSVVRRPAPRHDDRAWDRNPISERYVEDVRRVKSLIQAERATAGGLNAVVIVGHVTIPYSGIGYEDGHFDHNGAWPADAYYGDLDQEWSDETVRTGNNITYPPYRNVPGDGKFDASAFNDAASTTGQPLNGLEVPVGRIDFANLPAFRPDGEVELLRRYFDKNHRYRTGELTFDAPAIVGGFFYGPFNPDSLAVYHNGAWTLSRLFGAEWTGVKFGHAFAPGVSALWGFQGGYGNPNTLHNSAEAARVQGIEPVTAASLAARRTGASIGIHLLKGSYFCDWNLGENSFMRAVLATPDGGLASLWTRDRIWRTEPLAIGDPLGSALQLTARGNASTRATFLLGDPTLRLGVVPPPKGVRADRAGNAVRLAWSAGPSPASFNVYRAPAAIGPFTRLNPAPLVTPAFTDENAARSQRFYQVRALTLTTTGSGTYTNLSQAVTVSVD